MTTTGQFQIKPDYFTSEEECLAVARQRVNTNPRYKFFNQTHFTAGDTDQFEQYRDATNGQVCIPRISLSNNRFSDVDMSDRVQWAKYRDLGASAVMNTFNYLFHKFKKGIFLKIKNGQVSVFLPFSKKNFTNEWSRRIRVDPKYGDIMGFIRHIQSLEGRRFFPKSINKFFDSWYANNCLVRYEFPISEGDSNNPNMSDMFKTLCEERKVPDMEVFINRRDFPLLKKNGTEPYSHMYDTSNMPLLSHNYEKYAPVLSMVTTNNFADIPIPTGDDWARVSRSEGKFFARSCSRGFEVTPVPWDERKPTAVFRGGSTGCGVTIETNQRLKLAYISHTTPNDTDGLPLLDAGITNWNLRPRKLKKQRYLQTIDIKSLPFGLVPRLTPQEQAQYKYVINVEGHVAAYRLTLELGSGACVLLAASKYKMWFSNMIKPWVHFVPLKSDLSDIVDKIKWCKSHDAKCQEIAANSQAFAAKYLCKDGVLDYLQKLLLDLKKENGVYLYNSTTLIDMQYNKERHLLSKLTYPNTTKSISDISLIPSQKRSHSLMLGVEWLVRMVIDKGSFFDVAPQDREIFSNRMSTITHHTFAGFMCGVKSTKDPARLKEMVHETFVATHGTNHLLKQIPNFAYIFGMFNDENGSHMVMEYIHGQTLNDYIRSEEFTFQDYLMIILQLSLALHVAQRTCGLVHYDLAPWNIMIQKFNEPVSFDYVIDSTTVYRVNTQIVPIIIDMGRTHIISDDQHYGMIHMFQTSTVQDVLALLTSTIFEVSNLRLNKRGVTDLVKLANFLSGTDYRTKKFTETGKNGLGDIRFFFRKAKRYAELVSQNKGNLEKKTPLDLVKYIMKKFRYHFPIEESRNLIFHTNKGNARQVFDYAFASSANERALTFARVFHRVKTCDLPEPENVFLMYYTIQSMEDNMTSVYDIMLKFLQKAQIDDTKYKKKYKKTIKFLRRKYAAMIKAHTESPIEYNEVGTYTDTKCMYTMETFSDPQKILDLLREQGPIPSDLTPYKEIIEQILLYSGPHQLTPEIRRYYQENFMDLLRTNSVAMKAQIANKVSLINVKDDLYTADKDSLESALAKQRKSDCTQAKEYLRIYQQILE
jgi:hypothetical protein